MTMLAALVQTPFSEALGWALFHSLWQGALAAAALAALTRRSSASVRYVGGCLALVAILLAFTLTFWRELPETGIRWDRPAVPAPVAPLNSSAPVAPPPPSARCSPG